MPTKTEHVKFLEKGSQGSVDLVKYIQSDGSSPVYAAVKTVDFEKWNFLQKEALVLLNLKGCRGIVQCYNDYELEEDLDDDGSVIFKMVMEYAPAGDLTTFMDSYIDGRLPETMIKDFTRMILQGLVSVHSIGYVHCDLKPENILVFPCGQSYEVKISDFGSCTKAGKISHQWGYNPFVGSPIYMSPESVCNGVAVRGLDLWSLGCVVLEMYAGEPWPEVEFDDLMSVLLSGKAPEIPEDVPSDARDFIETCFARNPTNRGTASSLLLHRFLCEDDIYGLRRLFAAP